MIIIEPFVLGDYGKFTLYLSETSRIIIIPKGVPKRAEDNDIQYHPELISFKGMIDEEFGGNFRTSGVEHHVQELFYKKLVYASDIEKRIMVGHRIMKLDQLVERLLKEVHDDIKSGKLVPKRG